MALTTTQVSELYVAIFNRASEGNGNAYWAAKSLTAAQIADQMLATTDAATYFGSSVDTNQAFVELIYANTLNKTTADDADGIAYWVGKLDAGTSRGAMVADLVTAVASYSTSTDAATIVAYNQFNNRVTVSDNTAATLAVAPTDYSTSLSFGGDLTVTDDAATITTANLAVDAIANVGTTFTLTTTAGDVVVGTSLNDTVTATTATDDATDIVVDTSTTDHDTLNWDATASTAAVTVTNIENINVTIASTNGTNPVVAAGTFSGVQNLTITGTNVTVGGSSIAGDKDVTVTGLDASKVAKVTTGAATVNVAVTQATKAGVTVDAQTATGTIAVTGAATVNANLAASTVVMTKLTDTTEDAKAVTVNAALATSVTTADTGFTGLVTFNAAYASTITISNATGGAVVNGGTTSTADTTITVDNIDASGATITTGTGYDDSVTLTLKDITILLDGTSGADAATITAAGFISLDANTADLVETVNLSGNGAAVEYSMVTSVPTAYNLTGTQSVTVTNTAVAFAAATLADTTTAGTTTAKVTTVATADLSGIAADVIKLSDTGTAAVITVATGATIQIAADQTTSLEFAGKATGATVNLATADDTAANGTTIDLTVAAFTAATNVQTLNLDATVGKFTATSTTLDIVGADATTFAISGTKNVTLGTTIAKTVSAASLTGVLNMTVGVNATTASSVTSGTGSDIIVVNETNNTYTVTVDAGNGNNTLTLTDAKATSSFTTGAGSDTVVVGNADSFVIVTGDGSDTVQISDNIDADSIMVAGAGTSDKLEILDINSSAVDFSDNTNFAFTGFETLDIDAITSGAGVKISAAQFAGNSTITLLGDSATTDILTVTGLLTTNDTIDASNVTVTTATLVIDGASGNDIITGSAYADLISGGVGTDTINGGDGADTYVAVAAQIGVTVEGAGTGTSTGLVINLGSTAVTNTTVLSATAQFTADTVTSIASGTVAYLFGSSASTNTAVVDTLVSIENVTGSTGIDYIIGSATANTIKGGTGIDKITGGLGTDSFVTVSGDAGQGVSNTLTNWVNKDTIFGGVSFVAGETVTGAEVITDIAASETLNLGNADLVADANLTMIDDEYVIVQGVYVASTGVFTIGVGANTGADSLIVYDSDAAATFEYEFIVLQGVVTAEEGAVAAGIVTFA